MSTFPTLIARLIAGKASRAKGPRRAPACETLEGRRLLNAAWGGQQWVAAGANPPAHVQHHGPHAEGAFSPGGHGLHGLPTSASPQAQADFKTLQADLKTLRSEVPADLTAKVKADEAVVHQALGTLAPTQFKGPHGPHGAHDTTGTHASQPPKGMTGPQGMHGPHGFTPGGDSTAGLTAMLKKANVPDAQAAAIVADSQALQSAMKTVDPALQTKIVADRAALAKDLGTSLPSGLAGPKNDLGPMF